MKKNSILIFGLILFSSYLCGQNSKESVKSPSVPVLIKWADHQSGDFSFTNNWSYPEGIYKNEYGQLSCDGLCPPEIESMKDSTGRIYEDSLHAFYEIIDTTHQVHSIQCEAWCYEYNGTDFIEVYRLNKSRFKCITAMSIATHCNLNLDIQGDSCLASIELNSINQGTSIIFYCTKGYISVDKNQLKDGIMKADFSFDFENRMNLKKPFYWKGKIYSKIRL